PEREELEIGALPSVRQPPESASSPLGQGTTSGVNGRFGSCALTTWTAGAAGRGGALACGGAVPVALGEGALSPVAEAGACALSAVAVRSAAAPPRAVAPPRARSSSVSRSATISRVALAAPSAPSTPSSGHGGRSGGGRSPERSGHGGGAGDGVGGIGTDG